MISLVKDLSDGVRLIQLMVCAIGCFEAVSDISIQEIMGTSFMLKFTEPHSYFRAYR